MRQADGTGWMGFYCLSMLVVLSDSYATCWWPRALGARLDRKARRLLAHPLARLTLTPAIPILHYRLNIALELAKHNPVYEDIASKFFEHFLFISDAMVRFSFLFSLLFVEHSR